MRAFLQFNLIIYSRAPEGFLPRAPAHLRHAPAEGGGGLENGPGVVEAHEDRRNRRHIQPRDRAIEEEGVGEGGRDPRRRQPVHPADMTSLG